MKKQVLMILAFISVYLFWGGTYLGMKFALVSFSPALMAGLRHMSAGLILFTIGRLRRDSLPSLKEVKNAAIVGILLLLVGNGLVAWSEQRVPSAIASLMVASVPLWIALMNWRFGEKKQPSILQMTGILLGIFGIALLVLKSSQGGIGNFDIIGLMALLAASLAWSAGSLYSRFAKLPTSAFNNVSIQMMTGGFLLLTFALFNGEFTRLDVGMITNQALWAMAYLIFFGSVIAYTSYIWLMKNVNPTWVSTYAFVNPIVAVFLGWSLGGETLQGTALVSAIIILAAVIIITLSQRKR
ncbi:MAG: multidrug transporter [Erysipelotrichales bacterium]|nr:MAG: multidrug transporter [Erysipelotrichales bacterium]